MSHSHQSRRSSLQSLSSQALVDLSDCCCFRSLPRLGELVDQILFSAIAASLVLLVGLSLPVLASRSTGDQAPTEQAAPSGDTQIAGLIISE